MPAAITSQEETLIYEAVTDTSLLGLLQQKLAEVPHAYNPDHLKQFDQEYLKKFMLSELKTLPREQGALLEEKFKEKEITGEEIMSAGGSWAMSQLITQMLQKLKTDTPSEELISTLVELITCRNEMFATEVKHIENSYRAYLQKKVKQYS
jgi:hypothetical protein